MAGWALTRRLALHELSNDALAVVSHEMKTPLASMRMFIDTLRERRYHGGVRARRTNIWTSWRRKIPGWNGSWTEFPAVSRLDSPHGRRRVRHREPVRAEDVIAAARARLGPRLAKRSTARSGWKSGEPPPGPFPADGDALAAVLVNLLDNALKYSGDDPRVELRALRRSGEVVFEVSDHGIGIEPSEQPRIFERFYQSDSRLSRTHEGCGLGPEHRAFGGAGARRDGFRAKHAGAGEYVHRVRTASGKAPSSEGRRQKSRRSEAEDRISFAANPS